MRWGPFNKYKNSVTTELFIATSVGMYEAFGKQHYLDSAIKAWVWFKNSGLINAQGLVNDGLTDTCQYDPCDAGLIVGIMDRRPGLTIKGLYCLDCPSYTSTQGMNL
jgi:predicted alpha-1,6-mannanase (GH76 family)